MSFPARLAAGVAAVIVLAGAAVVFFASGGEAEIEGLVAEAVEAASRGDAEAVIAFLSRSYGSPSGGYPAVCARLRREVGAGRTFDRLELLGTAAQVEGEKAEAGVRVRVWAAARPAGEVRLELRLRKEEGGWKVVTAREVR